MKKNMGTTDRIIRVIVAIVFATLFFSRIVTGVWGGVLLIAASIFVITSLVGFCPLYVLAGMNTRNNRHKVNVE